MVQDELVHLREPTGRWRREDVGGRSLRIDGRRGLFPCSLRVRMEPVMKKDQRESSLTDITVIIPQV